MLNYPMTFTVTSASEAGIQSTWSTLSPNNNQKVIMAIPPEFNGPGGGLSPEDIYAMALTNCFIATFKVFAEKSRLSFTKIDVNTDLVVDRNDKGQPWMAEAHFKVSLHGASNVENANRLLEKTSQSCMILNSVNTVKKFEFNVSA